MPSENPETIIADLHRVREEIAAEFDRDLFAITAAARTQMEKSGRKVVRRTARPTRDRALIAQESAPSSG